MEQAVVEYSWFRGASRDGMEGSMNLVLEAVRRWEEKALLEAILLDLAEGVIVCNSAHQILLYNQSAARILGRPETLVTTAAIPSTLRSHRLHWHHGY